MKSVSASASANIHLQLPLNLPPGLLSKTTPPQVQMIPPHLGVWNLPPSLLPLEATQ